MNTTGPASFLSPVIGTGLQLHSNICPFEIFNRYFDQYIVFLIFLVLNIRYQFVYTPLRTEKVETGQFSLAVFFRVCQSHAKFGKNNLYARFAFFINPFSNKRYEIN
jgi:hypothetical protein